jgi:hypothetical protein
MNAKQALLLAVVTAVIAVTLAIPVYVEGHSPEPKGIRTSAQTPHHSDADAQIIEFKDGNKTSRGRNGGCLNPGGSPCACSGIPSNNQYYLTSFTDTDCACGKCDMYGAYFAADKQR